MTRLRPRPLTPSETRMALLVGVVAVLCGLMLCWRARTAAHEQLALARADHDAVVHQTRRLLALSRERVVAADRPRAQPDLVARLHACLRSAGIDPALLTQVSASEPRPVPGSARGSSTGGAPAPGDASRRNPGPALDRAVYMRQETGITIDPVRPADLARFLAAWREAEPLWTVRVVSLQRSPSAPEREDRYTALLTLESLFTQAGSGPSRAAAPPAANKPGSLELAASSYSRRTSTLRLALQEPIP